MPLAGLDWFSEILKGCGVSSSSKPSGACVSVSRYSWVSLSVDGCRYQPSSALLPWMVALPLESVVKVTSFVMPFGFTQLSPIFSSSLNFAPCTGMRTLSPSYLSSVML